MSTAASLKPKIGERINDHITIPTSSDVQLREIVTDFRKLETSSRIKLFKELRIRKPNKHSEVRRLVDVLFAIGGQEEISRRWLIEWCQPTCFSLLKHYWSKDPALPGLAENMLQSLRELTIKER